MSVRHKALVPGIILIGIGLYLLADRLYWPLPRFEHVYPFFFLLIGVASAARIRGKGHKDGVFPAFMFLTVGILFVLRNFDIIPYLYDWWAFWILGAGVGFLGSYIFNPEEWGMLIPGIALVMFGGLIVAREFDFYYDFNVGRYWPVILIVIGIVILLNGLKNQSENK